MVKQKDELNKNLSMDATTKRRITAFTKKIIRLEEEKFELEAENIQLSARINLLEK